MPPAAPPMAAPLPPPLLLLLARVGSSSAPSAAPLADGATLKDDDGDEPNEAVAVADGEPVVGALTDAVAVSVAVLVAESVGVQDVDSVALAVVVAVVDADAPRVRETDAVDVCVAVVLGESPALPPAPCEGDAGADGVSVDVGLSVPVSDAIEEEDLVVAADGVEEHVLDKLKLAAAVAVAFAVSVPLMDGVWLSVAVVVGGGDDVGV